MRYPKIETENGFVFYQDYRSTNNWERIKEDTVHCPICNELIKNNQDCYLAIVNTIFPNCFIHKACVDKEFHWILDEFKLEFLTGFLIREYNKFKEAQALIESQFKAWL
jgi:hypothetical protein